MSKSDLETCIQEVKDGNSHQFEYVINLYQNNIHRYVRYMLHNDRDVDDIVQEIFVKVYLNIKKYKANTNFEAWLYKIAYNTTMTVTTNEYGQNNLFAKEPQMVVEEYNRKGLDSPQQYIEKYNGRWAMMGIISGFISYAITGKFFFGIF